MSSKKQTPRQDQRESNRERRTSVVVYNDRVSHSLNNRVILSFLSGLNTPKALAVWMLYASNEHDQLLELPCDPLDYICCYKFRDDYQAVSLLSKSTFLKTSFDKKNKALEKFAQFEKLCGLTNTRFRYPHSDPLFTGLNASLHHAVRRKIDDILGEYSADEFLEGCSWGPGVSTSIKGTDTSATRKFRFENGILRKTYQWFRAVDFARHVHPQWKEVLTASDGTYSFDIQWGNTICTVPKNSKTDRVIAVEPGINLFLQKGIGKMLKRRLLRQGVDLSDQTINQERCKSALDLDLATVDFSSASDSISKSVVESLLPPRWLYLLELTRSPCYVPTKVKSTPSQEMTPWNKFSSMGNGFTFELESLIFYASACAVMTHLGLPGRPSVYGDDVILPSAAFSLFASFTEYLGFKVNPEKSFSTGLFRESCGVHYFDGLDVQPIFLKEKISNAQIVYKVANSIRLLAHRRRNYSGCDRKLYGAVRHLRLGIPNRLRFLVPKSNPTAGFISNFDEACPSRAGRGWDGYRYNGIRTQAVTQYADHLGHLVARIWSLKLPSGAMPLLRMDKTLSLDLPSRKWALRNIALAQRQIEEKESELASGNDISLRGVTRCYKHSFYCNDWYNFGAWM